MVSQGLEAEEIVQVALKALDGRSDGNPSTLDDLPTALYVTDREGVITWYNRACVDFAGRTPVANRDRWCVTWKLLTNDGYPLPPLDGGRVAVGLLPNFLARPLAQLEGYGMMIIIGLIFVLPIVGDQLGRNLNVIGWLLGGPVEAIIDAILRFTGNG